MATFQLNGTTFQEGDTLIISTPETGSLEVTTAFMGHCPDKVVMLNLGYVKTPLPCRSTMQSADVNARMRFYSDGNGYVNIGLYYCCGCPYDTHSHALEWRDLTIDGNRITANSLGQFNGMIHNHPVLDDYQHLVPKPVVVAPIAPIPLMPKVERPEPAPVQTVKKVEHIKEPSPAVNKKGQISLF